MRREEFRTKCKHTVSTWSLEEDGVSDEVMVIETHCPICGNYLPLRAVHDKSQFGCYCYNCDSRTIVVLKESVY